MEWWCRRQSRGRLTAGKKKIPPNWVEFLLPPGIWEDEALVEPVQTNSDQKSSDGPRLV